MQRFSPPVQRVFHRARAFLAVSTRAGRLSLALGAMLLLGSSLSALATLNTKPTITSATLSASTIDEGDTVTLNVTFTDPDVTDAHPIEIYWEYGLVSSRQEFVLPAGQLSFQVSHKYADNRSDAFPGDGRTVKVWVSDMQPGNDNTSGAGVVSTQLGITINNVAPTFAKGVEVKKFALQPGKVVIEGNVVDPGADTLSVTAAWGSSSQFPTLGVQPCSLVKGHFRCEHTYPATPRTYAVTLRVEDDEGAYTSQGVRVQIP